MRDDFFDRKLVVQFGIDSAGVYLEFKADYGDYIWL